MGNDWGGGRLEPKATLGYAPVPEHVQSLVGCKLTEYVKLVHTSSFTDCTINDNSHPLVLDINAKLV